MQTSKRKTRVWKAFGHSTSVLIHRFNKRVCNSAEIIPLYRVAVCSLQGQMLGMSDKKCIFDLA